MRLDLLIAGEHLRISSSPEVLAATRGRYGTFEHVALSPVSSSAPIELRILRSRAHFSPRFERPLEVVTRVSEMGEIVFGGPVRGCYSPFNRRGSIQDPDGLGAVDVLIRTALSVSLPLGGSVLLHGAALRSPDGRGLALCGDSGTGKSTAAAAFGAFSDEQVVLRPDGEGVELESTPYWGGRPLRCRCAGVVCLQRGSAPGYERIRGGSIARVLARHVVRYAALENVDRAIFRTLGAIAGRASVSLASCPEGEAFLPFLEERIGIRRAVA